MHTKQKKVKENRNNNKKSKKDYLFIAFCIGFYCLHCIIYVRICDLVFFFCIFVLLLLSCIFHFSFLTPFFNCILNISHGFPFHTFFRFTFLLFCFSFLFFCILFVANIAKPNQNVLNCNKISKEFNLCFHSISHLIGETHFKLATLDNISTNCTFCSFER